MNLSVPNEVFRVECTKLDIYVFLLWSKLLSQDEMDHHFEL